ncbi:MAG: glycosyltransferase [Actinobacteria bacterium]|nr:glycosyltransferase [Actinomycetota bacterium]
MSIEPLRSGGGNTLAAKLGLLLHVLPWAITTRRVARRVDAVHLRCPCNIALVALFSTWKAGCLRYAMYAGVWHDYAGEPRFFRLQRKLLATRWFAGPVSVYADRDPSRPHLEPFFSPSYSGADLDAATPGVEQKLARIRDASWEGPWRLVTVGRLTENKNQQTIVRAMARVADKGIDATLDIYGDGPLRSRLESLAAELGIGDLVTFRGSVDHGEVMAAFGRADLNLLSTRQEGFGKVLLEGMVHGVVPIFGESPVAGEISGHGRRGTVVPPDDDERMAQAIIDLTQDRETWESMVLDARRYASTMTLESFQQRVIDMLQRQWGIELAPSHLAPHVEPTDGEDGGEPAR